MATRSKAGATAPAVTKGNALEVPAQPGESNDNAMARLAVAGVAGNARSMVQFSAATFGELSLTGCVQALKSTAEDMNEGDLGAAVTMLAAQAVALNAMFGELARRANLNMGEHLGATETYMRLAMRAQGQCRATLETLAAIKNPPVVFARQANINNGGQQQVNNGAAGAPSVTDARAGETPAAPTELLEAGHGAWMDTGATGATGRADPPVEAVGTLHRPAKR